MSGWIVFLDQNDCQLLLIIKQLVFNYPSLQSRNNECETWNLNSFKEKKMEGEVYGEAEWDRIGKMFEHVKGMAV